MPERWTLPGLDDFNRPFFTTGRLALQECAACTTVQHPPEEVCHACQGTDFGVREVAGRGIVYSFVIVHHAANPSLTDRVPYAVILVSLEELPEVRIVGNLLDVAPDRVAIGLPVTAVWETIEADGETIQLPQWRLADPTDG
jgi:uncharacterized OB-fold protein